MPVFSSVWMDVLVNCEVIDSLLKLDLDIKEIHKKESSSLHKYMLFTVSETVTEIVNKAKEYQQQSSK